MLVSNVWRRLDYLLLLAIVGLAGYGLMMVHSATCAPTCERFVFSGSWASRQALYILAGLVIVVAAGSINYRFYRTFAYWGYLFGVLALAGVLVVGRGEAEYGSRRWIPLGLFDFQPSELMKLLLILTLARFFSDRDGRLSFRRGIASIVLLLPPLGLVYLQPDLGTSLSFIVIWFGMLAMAGARPIHLGLMILAGALAAPGVWLILREYQRARIATFLEHVVNPDADPFGEGYNILQARISIGSGGMFGRGWLEGTQTQLDYLRVKQSDFIFSVLAEEMGFLGAMVLFGLFIILLFRILRVADKARDDFGRLTAFGVACMLFYQTFVNLGANLTILPVTGVPLPLISFGGSAMLTLFSAFGILHSILIHSGRRAYSWATG